MDEYEQNIHALQELKQKRVTTFCSILNNNVQAILKVNFWKVAQLCADFHEAVRSGAKLTPEEAAMFICFMTTMYLCLIESVGNDYDHLCGLEMEEALEQLETWFSIKRGVDDE